MNLPLEELTANQVPVKLQNASFIKPFEMLTEMYSLPKYDEIDPTPWMTPFYYVFFGMMVADLGYGGLMALVTTIGLHFFRLPKGTKRFYEAVSNIIRSYDDLGIDLWLVFSERLCHFICYRQRKTFMAIFGLSMIFGGIQLFTGLYLAAKENIRKKDFFSSCQSRLFLARLAGGTFGCCCRKLALYRPSTRHIRIDYSRT